METDYGLNISASSYVKVPSNNAYNFGIGDFTVTVLFQTDRPGTLLSRKSPQSGSVEYAGWYLVLNDHGAIRMVTDNGLGYYRITSVPTAALDNTWHSVAVVRASGIITIYFDGSPLNASAESTLPSPLDVSSGRDLWMGRVDPALDPNNQFVGTIEDVTLWSTALTSNEIRDTIFNNVDVTASGLIGLWEMNKNFEDSSVIGNTGVPFGGVSFRPIYHCVWVEGVNCYAYCTIDMHEDVDDDFGARIGNPGRIVVPPAAQYNFGTRDFSLTALFQTRQPGAIASRKAGTETGPADAGWVLSVGAAGAFTLTTDNGSGYYAVTSAPTTALDGHWHSIAALRQNGQLLIYFDGVAVTTTPHQTLPTPLDVSSDTQVLIGSSDQPSLPDRQFIGVIEDVTIWNRAITADEIQLTRFNGLAGNEHGLVGFWKMDDDLSDSSPGNNPGSAVGDVSFVVVHHPASRRQALDIQPGSPYLYGGVLDKELADATFPADTQLTVYRPDGSKLAPADVSDTQEIIFNGDSVQAFLLQNPAAGTWIFELHSPTNVPVLFNAQTVPSNHIPQTIATSLLEVYKAPPAAQVRFLARHAPARLTSFSIGWSDVALWAGVGLATVAVVIAAAPVIAGVAVGSTVLAAAAAALTVGGILVQVGLGNRIASGSYQISYQLGVGTPTAGGTNLGSYSLVLDGRNYFQCLRNLLMAVQAGSYDSTGKTPPVAPTFANMVKAVSDANRSVYVMMFDTSAIYHMIENSDILKFYPRQLWPGVDGRDNYKSRDVLQQYKNVKICLEPYKSLASLTPIYSQHSKFAIFSVNGVKTALLGGFNVTPTYWDDDDHPMYDRSNFHTWHDSAVLLQGPIVDQVEQEFDRRWTKANMEHAPASEATYVKFACYHVKHDTCLDGPDQCSTTQPSSLPYVNPLVNEAQYPGDVLITSSEYNQRFTQIKDMLLRQIGAASSYMYFECFTFHDLDIVQAIAARIKASPGLICIINVPYPSRDNDTLDQRGQAYMMRIAFATMLINTDQWVSAAFDGGTIVTREQCTSWSVTFAEGMGIEYATFNYRIHDKDYSVALGPSLINVIPADSTRIVLTAAVRYFDQLNPNDPKFQLPGLSPNFRNIYNHSKLAVFDDSYAIVGSANFNSRSLSYDGECAIGIASTTKATQIRRAIFAHWGIDSPASWAAQMASFATHPTPGIGAVPLSIGVLSQVPIPWYWRYASFIYEFSDIN